MVLQKQQEVVVEEEAELEQVLKQELMVDFSQQMMVGEFQMQQAVLPQKQQGKQGEPS